MRIEEAIVDRNQNDEFWKVPTARALAIAELASFVSRMVAESGNPEGFDAKVWVLDWLTRPHPVLEGKRPEELMDTEEGRRSLREILGRMQSGAYS